MEKVTFHLAKIKLKELLITYPHNTLMNYFWSLFLILKCTRLWTYLPELTFDLPSDSEPVLVVFVPHPKKTSCWKIRTLTVFFSFVKRYSNNYVTKIYDKKTFIFKSKRSFRVSWFKMSLMFVPSDAVPLPGDPWARASLHQPGRVTGWLCGGGASSGRPEHRGEELQASAAHLEPAATGKLWKRDEQIKFKCLSSS